MDRATRTDQRGRPYTSTRGDVARVAYELFNARGFDQVTMVDVAAAADISRTTLFRYFPSKSRLLWFPMESAQARLRELVCSIPADAPLVDGIFDAYCTYYAEREGDGLLRLEREHLRVLVSSPAASTGTWDVFEAEAAMLASVIAARGEEGIGDAESSVLGWALEGAIWVAISRWAMDEGDTPLPYLEMARSAFAGLYETAGSAGRLGASAPAASRGVASGQSTPGGGHPRALGDPVRSSPG